MVSCAAVTVNVPAVSPPPMVSIPVIDTRSAAAASFSLLPNDAVQVAVTSSVTASDSVTGKVTSPPSLPEASPTLSSGVDGVPPPTTVPLMAMRSARPLVPACHALVESLYQSYWFSILHPDSNISSSSKSVFSRLWFACPNTTA